MEAFITLLTNNSYASGALVLGHSLRAANTSKQLAILITAAVSRAIRDRLAAVYDAVIEIGEIDSHSTSNLQLLGRPELGITLTKIHVFNQTQYSKVVFLDADTLVLRNIDELFDTAANGALDDQDRNKRFAAAPDAGWPDCFNSGVFVCRPSYADYTGLIEMASQQGTFDGGDQGLLNSYFSGWSRGDSSNRLPFVYNTTPSSVYSYAPAFQQYKDKLAVIHFVGSFKPWQWLRFADGTVFPRNTSSSDSITLVQQWWNVFDKFVGGKPSDIHEVTHGYDLPPISQWDHVGLDGQPKEPEIERKPHYEGWFQAYDHQNQKQPASLIHSHTAGTETRHEHHLQGHQHQHEHHADQEQHQDRQHPVVMPGHEHDGEQHHKPPEQWRPPIPPRLADRLDWHHQHQDNHQHHSHHHHEHHEHHEQQEHHHQHTDPQYAHNPHHLTDYHYQPPPPPPKVPELPEPDFHRYDPNVIVNGKDERQTHHHTSGSHSSVDREMNPHHLTDYRYRLPPTIDTPDVAVGAATFAAIIPEPVGLPDMYYPNAWDLPEDPRRAHPAIEPVPLLIEDTTNDDNTSIPSGKGRPIFPWESSGPSTPSKSPRTPTRTYYNYSAGAEELKRQKEIEISRRLEFEEAALERIRREEYSRYERDRMKEEAQERVSGSQAFENFRLVNAWDVDLGVQMSILQKTERRRPRSRKSSAGGIRKGYGLEDMYAYEARQRQEQYEAEIIRKRRDEEERWQKEQEEARIKEEEMRIEKQRLAKLARIRAQQRQKEEEESSKYVFRNAWDPPNVAITKKKLRIEDEEVEMALPLRQNRRSMLGVSSSSSSNGANAPGDGSVRITAAARAGRAATAVSGDGATVSGGRSGWSQRTTSVVSDDTRVDQAQHKARSEAIRSGQDTKVTEQRLAAAAEVAGAAAGVVALAGAGTLLASHSTAASKTSTTTANRSEAAFSSTTKMTAPGSHRFVRTTVTTTITRRKFQNGAVVSSSTDTSTTGGEIMFEIPAGPRSGSYFGTPARRTVTVRSSEGASRLASHAETTASRTATSSSTQRAITSRQSTESATTHREQSEEAHSSRQIARVDTPPGVHKVGERTITTTTTRTLSREDGATSQSQTVSSEVTSSGSTSSTKATMSEAKKAVGSTLHIDTTSPAREQSDEEEKESINAEERQRRTDLREKEASAVAVAKAKEVLSKYPQATSRYATTKHSASGSTSSSSGQKVTSEALLYASDPNLPSTSSTSTGKGKELKVHTVQTSGSQVEDDHIYQEENLEELEYFGERHTRAGLPLGSPYMPSTPLGNMSHRHSASASGFSSRAGSRPTTPGPSTPSRFGPGTPKGITKRAFELKKDALIGGGSVQGHKQQEQRQTGQVDTGFSNYKIEWNWKELLGKKPRHWSAEEGEEYYDPYNALSTHGSLIDSDEDDGRVLESSSDSEEEEEDVRLRQGKAGGNGSSGSGSGSSAAAGGFAAGEDSEFTRESGFVIRGGKIARRRSSMALDRREL